MSFGLNARNAGNLSGFRVPRFESPMWPELGTQLIAPKKFHVCATESEPVILTRVRRHMGSRGSAPAPSLVRAPTSAGCSRGSGTSGAGRRPDRDAPNGMGDSSARRGRAFFCAIDTDTNREPLASPPRAIELVSSPQSAPSGECSKLSEHPQDGADPQQIYATIFNQPDQSRHDDRREVGELVLEGRGLRVLSGAIDRVRRGLRPCGQNP